MQRTLNLLNLRNGQVCKVIFFFIFRKKINKTPNGYGSFVWKIDKPSNVYFKFYLISKNRGTCYARVYCFVKLFLARRRQGVQYSVFSDELLEFPHSRAVLLYLIA